MEPLLAWCLVALMGVVHGLHPASGWWFALSSTGAGGEGRWRPLLLAVAVGQVAAIGVWMAIALAGLWIDARAVRGVAALMLLGLAAGELWRREAMHCAGSQEACWRASLGSCALGCTQGMALLLLPSVTPLCVSGELGAAFNRSPSLWVVSAVFAHTLALLLTTWIVGQGMWRVRVHVGGVLAPHRLRLLGAGVMGLGAVLLAWP